MMVTGDNTRVTKLSSASDVVRVIPSVKNIMESVSKFHFVHLCVTCISCQNFVFVTDVESIAVMNRRKHVLHVGICAVS
jgi:hypothetical protein